MSGAAAPPESGGCDPALAMRGTVEGFYGPPWSHAERLAHLAFSARIGLNAYVYAPKDDPYHRARWRDPYPAGELDQLAALAARARALGIRFIYAISPGLDMRFAEDAEHRVLAAKAGQVCDAGVDSVALFFDDVPAGLTRPEERERWPGAGAAHGETCTRFVADALAVRGIREPLLVCPTDYAGTEPTPYRRQFARTAPPDVLIAWTGSDIVVGSVSREDIDRAAASYRRRLVLWDNFPVNDFEPSRLFLGPLTGRTTELAGSALVGVLANPMVSATPSQIPLVSVADWAADPRGYDPAASAERALALVAGPAAADLAPLVRACRAWPPGADQDPELTRAVDGVRTGEPAAAAVLTARLGELADGCRAAAEPAVLVSALRPWLAAGASVAEAGLAAVRLLRATGQLPPETAAAAGGPGGAVTAERIRRLRGETRRALAAAESHYADVLRSVVPPFVRDALDRTAPPAAGRPAAAATALLVTGPRRSAGDEAITELLQQRGHAVCRRAAPAAADIERAALVIVTRGAEPAAVAAVAGVGVPLLAWHGFVPLGLASTSAVLLARDRLRIVDPADPLAAGLDGVVRVYRGPARLTVAEVGPDARVVARVVGEDRPALFGYPTGARLADGTTAPATRIGLFLGRDGLAPWLPTAAGRAIVLAALDRAAATGPRRAGPPAVAPARHAGEDTAAGRGDAGPGRSA